MLAACNTYCATLNVTEEKKDKEDKNGCFAIIDVTEGKGALHYGKQKESIWLR